MRNEITSLGNAFDKVRSLNLDITLDQKLKLSEIIGQLAREEYNSGSEMAQKYLNK